MTKTIDYYLTVNSPWALLGAARFRRIVETAGANVIVHAVDINRVFDSTGGLPLPKRSPQRQAYRLVELARWSKAYDIALNMKPSHAVAPTLGNMCVIAVREGGGDALAAAEAIGHAYWVDDQDISDKTVLMAALDRTGIAGAAVVGQAESDLAIAEIYDSETQSAIEQGVFGAPWYVVDGTPYWGQDRLAVLADDLGISI